MKTFLQLLAAGVISLVLQACASDAGRDAPRPGIERSATSRMSATVTAINHQQRLVTLRGEDGNFVTLEVSEAARNLPQVEVGDIVEVEYYESVALFAQLPDGEPATGVKAATARTPLGDKPGAGAAETYTLKATVEAIDYAARLITLRGPDGGVTTTRVGESVQRLDEIRQGDEIVVQYTRAFAISVREP